MQFPRLTPLQARFAASLAASILLGLTYLFLTHSKFAYAADVDSILNLDHNHHRLAEQQLELDGVNIKGNRARAGLSYEADFLGLDRSIIGRQEEQRANLQNNVPSSLELAAGTTNQYEFILSGSPESVWISVSVCSQPQPEGDSTAIAPPVTLYVSTNEGNQQPGPGASGQEEVVGFAGLMNFEFRNPTGSIFFAVNAPDATGFTGGYTVEVAASTDAPYHSYHGADDFYFLMDVDANGAFFMSNNLSDTNATNDASFRSLMDGEPLYTIFVLPQGDGDLNGLEQSYCALREASRQANLTLTASMTTRGGDHRAKQQIHVQGLNSSTSYAAFWALNPTGTDTSARGPTLWPSKNFITHSTGNCQIIYDLPFCSEIAYSVPSNPSFNTTALAQVYDNHTQTLYRGFNFSLQQIPCNTTNTAQYSLARTCTDCAEDYKTWLCLVSIPRCKDYTDPLPWLQPRNLAAPFPNGTALPDTDSLVNSTSLSRLATNSSRGGLVDEVIQPGPYKELLPCVDYCYALVRSCPASFGFGCPVRGKGLERSYGEEGTGDEAMCNHLRIPQQRSGAGRVMQRGASVAVRVAVGVVGFLAL